MTGPRLLRASGSLVFSIVLGVSACSNEPTGGSTGTAGTSGVAGTGAAGTTGDAGTTGSAGTTGAGGTTGAAGTSNAAAGTTGAAGGGAAGTAVVGDTPAWRELMVMDAKRHDVRFSARMADPTVSDPESHPGDMQSGVVDTSKPLKKKLCVVLPGIGNGPGQGIGFWAAGKGYHVFSVAYHNNVGAGDGSPDAMGNTRMNQFDGKGRTPAAINTTRADSIEGRVIKGLQYLAEKDPGADWGWFLNQDGTMRWSDGCFIGYSYGATHLAVISRYVRVGLGVSTSGPQSEGHPDSTWLKIPSATPVERLFSIWGTSDEPATTSNGYKSHYTVTTGLLGWPGDVVHTMQDAPPGTPPYNGSHRLSVDGQGHTEFCAGDHPYCSYMFGL